MEGAKVDLTQMLISLLPVLLGGIIATIGGLAGPSLIHWLSEKSDKRKRRQEKFEELIGSLYEHEHWLGVMRNIRVFGREDTDPPSPLPRARAIAAIYFPTFVDQITELEMTARVYEVWMLQAGQKRLKNDLDGSGEGMGDAYKPYLERFTALISELQKWATGKFRH